MPDALRCTLQLGKHYTWKTCRGREQLALTDEGMAAMKAAGFTETQMIEIELCHVGGELMPWVTVTPLKAIAH